MAAIFLASGTSDPGVNVAGWDKLLHAMAYATKVANGAQAAVRWSKMAINKLIEQHQGSSLDFGLATEFVCSSGTEDMQEAASAFVEKREPRFKGR